MNLVQENLVDTKISEMLTKEAISALSTLQDGRFTLFKIHVATEALLVRARFKRFLLFSPIEQRVKENYTLLMDRQFIRVSVSVFRLSSSPTDFNEASKSPNQYHS